MGAVMRHFRMRVSKDEDHDESEKTCAVESGKARERVVDGHLLQDSDAFLRGVDAGFTHSFEPYFLARSKGAVLENEVEEEGSC